MIFLSYLRKVNFPKTLFITIGTECNSKCKYCHMWMTKEHSGGLTTEEKVKVIEGFQKINPDGKVVLTGGETMLKYDEFFILTKECKRLKLLSAANTNASLINDQNIKKVMVEGPNHLVISLDSHIEKIHDFSRGMDGSYQHNVDILKKLVVAKKKNNYQNEIFTNSVIYDLNINDLLEYINFVEKIGMDGCTFQIISRTFYRKGDGDYFFKHHFFKDKAEATSKIQDIINALPDHKIVRTTKQDFEWMKLYIENPDFIGEQVCGSHEKNIMIDCYGEIQLCFNMTKINQNKSLGNIRDFDYDISRVWDSDEADKVRLIMMNCRLNCGMLNCHRRK
jgi:MoaA/NifB/PqqE/SkfB family radical SAM enzyme